MPDPPEIPSALCERCGNLMRIHPQRMAETGCTVPLKLCGTCDGSGWYSPHGGEYGGRKCPDCKGTGNITSITQTEEP